LTGRAGLPTGISWVEDVRNWTRREIVWRLWFAGVCAVVFLGSVLAYRDLFVAGTCRERSQVNCTSHSAALNWWLGIQWAAVTVFVIVCATILIRTLFALPNREERLLLGTTGAGTVLTTSALAIGLAYPMNLTFLREQQANGLFGIKAAAVYASVTESVVPGFVAVVVLGIVGWLAYRLARATGLPRVVTRRRRRLRGVA